jgi:predicted phosphoribosyltransferase
MFNDRWDAGEKLARALENYRNKAALVLAIPRGGVIVGYPIAKRLNADFSLIVARKLPFPDNPESGWGAIAEDGSLFVFDDAKHWLPESTRKQIIREQERETQRRVTALRGGKPLPEIAARTVVLVDDGIAMGSTMRAAILNCKNQKAAKIIVATPVCGPETAREFQKLVDEFVVLETPEFFHAVAQVYRHWHDVPDHEVIEVLDRWEKERSS